MTVYGSHAAPADHLKLCLQIYPAIKHWFHRWLCMGSHTAPADLPLEWQFHRFLLWQLIFHSYSESSSFGIPGPGSSTPIQWWFHRFLWNSYFIPTLRAYHLADQVLADLPQFNSNCAHIGRPSVGRSNPPIKWHFHRFLLWQLTTLRAQHLADQVLADLLPPIKWKFHRFPWNSYFILTLRAQHLADQVLADLPPIKWQFTDSCSTLRAHIYQTPVKWWFHRFLWNSYFIHTLRAQHLTDQVLAQLPPSSKAISQIPTLVWELIFGRPSVGRSTPIKWQFHRFLLWQLTFDDSSYFIPTLRAWHLADQVLADLPPFFEWQFHWFLLWQLLFHSYSESLSFGRPGPGISTSPSNSDFIDSCLWQLTMLRAQHLTDQVLAQLPPSSKAISQIPALIWELIFGRPRVGRSTPCQMAISQISALTAHISFLLWELIIWQTRSWQIYLPSNGDFTDSCSDSSLLWELIIWQTRSWQIYPPHQMAISQIPALTAHISWQLIFHS